MAAPDLEQLIADLGRLVRDEVARHPQGHLLGVPGREVELSLRLPLAGADALDAGSLESRAAAIRADLRAEIETLLALTTAFEAGRVPDLRTGEPGTEGTLPTNGRFVFAGWTPSGRPRFLDFAQLLLERQHPDQHRLYGRPPALLTLTLDREDLRRELLPAFAEPEVPDAPRVRVHGQVVAGWFVVPRAAGTDAVLALTLQVVSVAAGSSPRRYALNVVGAGPDGEALSEVVARLDAEHAVPESGEPPWQHAVAWAQKALETLTPRPSPRGSKRKRPGNETAQASGEAPEKRIRGILAGLARRLEQRQRSRRRRTDHAEKRHRGGDRPTRMALQDLAGAGAGEILVDERRDTMVVLGERGRAHVFNEIGKLVTSIRYTPDSIEKKRRLDIWRPASREEIQSLRKTVGV